MSRWAWLGLVMFAGACAPPPAERLRNPKPVHPPPEVSDRAPTRRVAEVQLLPRPNIDISAWIPDASEELRWPLTGMIHPVLEPHYAIAPVFAMPGVAWTELCARGAQNRTLPGADRDHVAYLRAWCAAGDHDLDRAVDTLGKLRQSTVPGMAAAVRLDIANIVADAGSGDQAQKLLARAMIDDPALDDVIAATYAEVGSRDDAAMFNTMALGAAATTDVRCRRLVKRIVLAGEPLAIASMTELERLGTSTPQAPADQTCARLVALLHCSLQQRCTAQFMTGGVDAKVALLVDAYEGWPSLGASAEGWLRIADGARSAMPLPGAEALAARAIGNGLLKPTCDDASRTLRERGIAVLAAPKLDNSDAVMLAELVQDFDRHCPSTTP